jgi:hypothetical protein
VPETDLLPGEPTQPYVPMFTGGLVLPQDPIEDDAGPDDRADGLADVESAGSKAAEPVAVSAHPIQVPGEYQSLKRWKLALVVACVWAFAAAAGWGLYYWWYHSLDKTAPVFVVLVFVIVCTVGGLLVAMIPHRPVAAAAAIAMMSAPLAATAGAAVIHGLYFCEWASRCLLGVLPY